MPGSWTVHHERSLNQNRKWIVIGPERLLESLQNWTENPGLLVHMNLIPHYQPFKSFPCG